MTTRVAAATSFLDVAIAVCESRRELDVEHLVITLDAGPGDRPLIIVDNVPDVSDELRMAWLEMRAHDDPHYRALRENRVPVMIRRTSQHTLVLALMRPSFDLLGTIRCTRTRAFDAVAREELATLAWFVSLRLAHVGVPKPGVHKLTPRQRDVARLVATARTNAQIGDELGLSENTVKKHLKDIFEALAVQNRTELAGAIAAAPLHELRAGVTRIGETAVTTCHPKGY